MTKIQKPTKPPVFCFSITCPYSKPDGDRYTCEYAPRYWKFMDECERYKDHKKIQKQEELNNEY